MHSCPGKMRGLEYQLAILTDVVETPSDASDHGSFPVASAWPKLPVAKTSKQDPGQCLAVLEWETAGAVQTLGLGSRWQQREESCDNISSDHCTRRDPPG